MQTQIHAIQASFSHLRREKKTRHRDIAQQLGISEGELIAAHAGLAMPPAGFLMGAVRLQPAWPAIIEALEPLGEVMALTRNASCVHEKVGVYRNASHSSHVGLVLGGEIDLRVFYSQWAHGFAVSEQGDTAVQRSLQFFDASGSAIHKIFLKPHSELAAYEALVSRFSDADQGAGIAVTAAPAAAPEKPDVDIDVAGLRAAWAGLRDTHEFFGLLKNFSVSRLQGLRLAEARFVQSVDKGCVLDLLNDAARENVSIMAFVGNPGMLQIHAGLVQKIAATGPWINVLDARFNLHLRIDHIASAWVVKKPTVDGLVTSLELFDEQGETILMFFGERKPGTQESCAWRAMIDNALWEHELCSA